MPYCEGTGGIQLPPVTLSIGGFKRCNIAFAPAKLPILTTVRFRTTGYEFGHLSLRLANRG